MRLHLPRASSACRRWPRLVEDKNCQFQQKSTFDKARRSMWALTIASSHDSECRLGRMAPWPLPVVEKQHREHGERTLSGASHENIINTILRYGQAPEKTAISSARGYTLASHMLRIESPRLKSYSPDKIICVGVPACYVDIRKYCTNSANFNSATSLENT